ncbi:MAG: hypothetical protein HY556_02610 [Euryarchaeota archaeon]|nr:hypothetical protein [Euryarchaeota archaeon]
MVNAILTGTFPRSEELVAATRDHDRKRIDDAQLEAAFAKDFDNVTRIQRDAGFAFVTDGNLRWQDVTRPFAENLDGVSVGTLTRYFDNNCFYRQATVTGNLRPKKAGFINKYVETRAFKQGEKWGVILPSPFTFAGLARDEYFGSREKLALAFGDALRSEVQSLQSAGASFIQFNDPAVVRLAPSKREVAATGEAIGAALQGFRGTSSYHTYFGDVTPWAAELAKFPVGYIGIDLHAAHEFAKSPFAGKHLILGVVDGRNSLVEDPKAIASHVKTIKQANPGVNILIGPNSDLELLPATVAAKKVAALGQAAKIAGGA